MECWKKNDVMAKQMVDISRLGMRSQKIGRILKFLGKTNANSLIWSLLLKILWKRWEHWASFFYVQHLGMRKSPFSLIRNIPVFEKSAWLDAVTCDQPPQWWVLNPGQWLLVVTHPLLSPCYWAGHFWELVQFPWTYMMVPLSYKSIYKPNFNYWKKVSLP